MLGDHLIEIRRRTIPFGQTNEALDRANVLNIKSESRDIAGETKRGTSDRAQDILRAIGNEIDPYRPTLRSAYRMSCVTVPSHSSL